MFEHMVELVESVLPDGWTVYDPEMAPDFTLECPHGYQIETDGRCSKGCVSPLIALGLM